MREDQDFLWIPISNIDGSSFIAEIAKHKRLHHNLSEGRTAFKMPPGPPTPQPTSIATSPRVSSAPTSTSQRATSLERVTTRVGNVEGTLKTKASKAKVSEMEKRLAKLEMILGVSSTQLQWKRIGSDQVVQDTDPTDEIFLLPKDVYSIVATCDWNSFPFWFSLLAVIGLQYAFLVLLLENQVGVEDDNFFGTPANVEETVRAAQVLAIIIALFSQGDLRLGIEGLALGTPNIYEGDSRFKDIGPCLWYFAYIIRFLQGLGNLFASFVLLIQAESVFDLTLNFLGVQFISGLDDLAFELGQEGYFGSSMQRTVTDVIQARFIRRDSAPCKALCRDSSHVIGMVMVLVAMVSIFWNQAVEQEQGTFAVEYVTAEFGDEVIPFLGLFNGCYGAKKEGQPLNRRLVYEQIGSEEVGGKFGFCDNLKEDDVSEGWVFFDGNSIESGCEEYILRSGTTNTFDILDATSNQWYTRDGQLVDYLQVSELPEDSHRSECGLKTLRQTIDSCDQVDVPVRFDSLLQGTRSLLFEKLPVTETQAGDSLDATRSHPIYLGGSSSEIILFTGRRWVLTAAEHISEEPLWSTLRDDTGWNDGAVIDYFYKNKGFQAIEQIKAPKKPWVLAMSDIVGTTTDPGTPLALRWFNVRYESSNSTKDTTRSFPFADVTRPQEATLGCARCDDDLVECANEGVCVDGVCECKNRASGVLCRDAPLGDGVCDEFFNREEFNFDGGDCCASTCTGPLCGANGLSVAFGVDLSNNTFLNQYLEESTMVGFEKCKDPDMELFTIELVPIEEVYYPALGNEDCGLEAVTVICDGLVYLQTPNLYMGESVDEVEQCHEDGPLIQPIHLPAGASCELSRPLDDFEWFFEILLFRGNGTDSPSILKGNNGKTSLTWSVPSGCLQEVFTEYLGDASRLYDIMSPQGRAIQTMAADGTSALLCTFNQDLAKERYALTVFNISVGLESTNWQEHQCYGWGSARYGIDINCNDDDRVVSIKGSSRWGGIDMLGGTIPSELFLLSHLSYLDFRGLDEIFGTLPSEIGLLSSLTHLSLRETNIEGPLPTEIGLLSNLLHCDLMESYFNGTLPTEIGNLSNLSYLNLGDNKLTGNLPSEIGLLTGLSYLNLGDNKLTGNLPSEIRLLTELVELNLEGNSFQDSLPSEIFLLSNLSSLNLQDLLLGSLPTEIGQLSKLATLRLGSLEGSVIPSEIGLLTQLTSANIESIVMSGGTLPTEIGYFSSLDSLSLHRKNLVGALPTELFLLSQLTALSLGANDLTGTLPTEICQLSRLVELFMSDNRFTGQLPTELGCLTKLTSLGMYGNDFSGTLVTEIGALSWLTDSRLEGNRLGGSIPSSIGDISQLTWLDLSSNQLTGTIPESIWNLEMLEYLILENNRLHGSISESISSLNSQLGYLNLANNSFTGSFPALPSSIWRCTISGNCFQNIANALASDCDVSDNCV